MAIATTRLARAFRRAGLPLRFGRRGDGLLELMFEDGSRITLDLREGEFVETDIAGNAFYPLRQIICDSLGFSPDKPDNTTDLEWGL